MKFVQQLEQWINLPVIFNSGYAMSYETSISQDNWFMQTKRWNIPTVEFHLNIARDGGIHEDICLEDHRAFIFNLLNNRIVDVANFYSGLPKANPHWFKWNYEPGTINGYRPFVALSLIVGGLYPHAESFSIPIQQLFNEEWGELIMDTQIVSIYRKDYSSFLKTCASLKYFSIISNFITSASRYY